MVLQVRGKPGAAVLPGAQQATLGVAQIAQHERRAVDRRLHVVGSPERGAGLGQRGDHQRVPRGQALVVQAGADPVRAGLEQPAANLVERLRGWLGPSPLQDQGVLERSRAEVLERGGGQVRAEGIAQLGLAPHVELALDALGVGVERRAEAALGTAHLAQRPVERLAANPPEALPPRDLPAVEVGAGEQRVVVEHLLEVGHGPGGVDRVAGEAAADLVVDPAAGHRLERAERHLVLAAGQQELDHVAPAGTSAPVRSRRSPGRSRSTATPARRADPRRGSARPRARAARWRSAPGPSACPGRGSPRGASAHASATPSSTIRQLGSPCRDSGGK